MRHGRYLPIAAVLLCAAITLTGCPSAFRAKDAPSTSTSAAADRTASTPSLRASSVIWVDFSFEGDDEDCDGSEMFPYPNLTSALAVAAPGDTIRIRGGGTTSCSPECLRITQTVRIEANGGPVQVGATGTVALVPNVVNMTQAAAETAITDAGLTPGAASQQYHDTIPSGCVISQDPTAGRIVPVGTVVALVVSKGPSPVPPTVTSFAISNGAAATSSRDVTLNNTCSGGPTHYMASESSTFTGATWKTYGTAPLFTLSTGLGTKTVYFKVKNAAGESLPAADTIVLNEPDPGEQETVWLPGDVPLAMVWVPGGVFWMGRYAGEQDSFIEEDPRHQVTVPGLWVAKYELTKRQWKAVMNTEPWSGQTYVLDDLDSPAVCVSWDDAKAFITALNTYTGLTLRLPSESEWEYACRAGTATRFYWGDDPTYTVGDAYCWWMYNAWNVGEIYAHVVGQKLPNAWGLYDMSGNVWEWCQDWYHLSYTGAPADGTAWESPTGPNHVLRGGCRGSSGNLCRSAFRTNSSPSDANSAIGFRVCGNW